MCANGMCAHGAYVVRETIGVIFGFLIHIFIKLGTLIVGTKSQFNKKHSKKKPHVAQHLTKFVFNIWHHFC